MQANTYDKLTETFELTAPDASAVQLVGDFTDWERSPINLRRQDDGVWNGTAELESGPHHYRFVIDGRLTCLMIRAAVAIVLAAMIGLLTGPALAEEKAAADQMDFRGTVKAVDQKEGTVVVQGFWSTRRFNVGDRCKMSLEDKPDAAIHELRPGHKVEVRYGEVGGVRVASQIQQQNLRWAGHVAAVNPAQRTLTVQHGRGSKVFTTDRDCKVMTPGDRVGTLTDLKIGQKVSLSYVTVSSTNLAQKIENRDLQFIGTVQAIDAQARTVKASQLLSGDRKFHLAKDCQIVIDGHATGRLSDLRIGQKLSISYEEADGVLVANRLASEGASASAVERQAARQGGASE